MESKEKRINTVYDELHVEEVSTKDKVKNDFKKQVQLVRNGKPKTGILKHNLIEFDINKFKQKQKICPTCRNNGLTSYIHSPRLESSKTWVGLCDKCGTAANFFTPTPVQKLVESINSPIINVISGFGSGKTEFDMWYVAKRAITVDGSDIVIAGGAKEGLSQAKSFLEGHFGRPWRDTKDSKGDFKIMNEERWVLKNGSKIRFLNVASGVPEKFRSWELDLVVMVEASADAFYKPLDAQGSFWDEISKRMRRSTSNVEALDFEGNSFTYIDEIGRTTPYLYGTIHKVILESNPKNSDIIPNVFNKSSVLLATEKVANIEKTFERFNKNYDAWVNGESGIVTILASSNDNPMLTEKYLKDAFPPGTSPAYIARMRDADLSQNESQVYQKAQDNKTKRKSAEYYRTADKVFNVMDPGTTDPAAIMYAAAWKNYENTGKPHVEIFHAHKTKGGTAREGNSLREIADHLDMTELQYGLTQYDFKENQIARWYIDPATGKKKRLIRIADSAMWKSEKAGDEMIQDHTNEAEKYRKRGFDFKQALKGQQSISYGIDLVDSYFDSGVLKWVEDLIDLENEFIRYEYETDSKGHLKPKDKDNHLMDDIRYLIFEVDSWLNDLGMAPSVISGEGNKIREIMARRKVNRDNREAAADEVINNLGLGDMFNTRSNMAAMASSNKFQSKGKKTWK